MVIKHSLNENPSELTLESNLLPCPCVHLPMAQSDTAVRLPYLLPYLKRNPTERNCRIISGQKLGVLAERRGEDHSVHGT